MASKGKGAKGETSAAGANKTLQPNVNGAQNYELPWYFLGHLYLLFTS